MEEKTSKQNFYSSDEITKKINATTNIKHKAMIMLMFSGGFRLSELLEAGVDISYIQKLLGHSLSKTTEIYTHVINKHLQKI